MALNSANGDRVVLTEDSCIASPGWLTAITGVSPDGRGAVGGVVEAMPGISNAMWAFCYVDFFKYMRPLAAGTAPTLSVCNVAYREPILWKSRMRGRKDLSRPKCTICSSRSSGRCG